MTHTTIPFIAPETRLKDLIQVRFDKFHHDHPEVYTKLVSLAREMRAIGKKDYPIRRLYFALRWYFEIETTGHSFRLYNNFAPLYAVLIMAREPDLKGIFDPRRITPARRVIPDPQSAKAA
jgi:hypothetical protein